MSDDTNASINDQDSAENDGGISSDTVMIIAILSICVICLLVVTSISFFTWWCYVRRQESLRIHHKTRKMEHLKYLEEYSIRTEEDEDASPRSDVTKRSDVTNGYKNNANDSGYTINEWDPTKVDHSTSFETSDASLVASANRKHLNNNDSTYENHAASQDSDLVTNLDDVHL